MPVHTILIVEDDEFQCAVVADSFLKNGYRVLTAASGNTFKSVLLQQTVSLVLLDLNLPDADGLELLRDLRMTNNVLLMVVSGRKDERDRIVALSLGADDFVCKPVSAHELVLRARNLLARQQQALSSKDLDHQTPAPELPQETLSNGWRLDCKRRVLTRDNGESQPLTQAEFALLRRLAEANGAVVSREDIFQHLVSEVGLTNVETLSTLIYRLRRKLRDHKGAEVIVTLSRVGYRVNLASSSADLAYPLAKRGQ